MKITAEFESVDFADMTAAAVRQNLSKMTNIKVTSSAPKKQEQFIQSPIISSLYFGISGQNYAVPVPVSDIMDNGIYNGSNDNSKAYLEVICRREEASKVSQIIIGHGGRNISKI
jgi:hypothetical protein